MSQLEILTNSLQLMAVLFDKAMSLMTAEQILELNAFSDTLTPDIVAEKNKAYLGE